MIYIIHFSFLKKMGITFNGIILYIHCLSAIFTHYHNLYKLQMSFLDSLKHKINTKTKPLGALGKLEAIAEQIATIQGTLSPTLSQPTIIIFAADHGITQQGVSPYPQAVTAQMVLNFLNQGAAINVFCKQHNIALQIVDAGVNHIFDAHPLLLNYKVAMGSANYLHQAAITAEQLLQCQTIATKIVDDAINNGCNIIGFGEMGIGNTSSASIIMSHYCKLPIAACVGRGAGCTDEQLLHKTKVLEQAMARCPQPKNATELLMQFGGFEIACLTYAYLHAYQKNITIMVDGFIASAAFMCAQELQPNIKSHAIFCHASNEQGHKLLLQHLQAEPILNLGMRLGEGSGCAVAYPLIQSAVQFLNEMASFESAGVSTQN
jgi:nicotinate-nucleotide--dimethylbenzimidazole phosphoribosyltransferase